MERGYHMSIPIAVAIVILISTFLLYVGGFLYLIIFALILQVGKHLSSQSNITGKWKVNKNILILHLVIIGLLMFIAFLFPFFTINLRNITIGLLLFVGACCYSFFMSLKKED